jgi:modification methylase
MTKHLLVNADSRDMHEVKDESVHLVVTSPPYFNAREYSQWKTYEDYLQDMKKVFEECRRVLCYGGFMCVNISPVLDNGSRKNIPCHFCNILEEINMDFKEDIIWRKPDGAAHLRMGGWSQNENRPLSYYPNIVTEYIYVFKKGNYERFGKFFYKEWESIDNIPKDMKTNVWEFNPVLASQVGHPAPYPLELANRCIRLYSFAGDTVLDPFLGSGTTSESAFNLGRNSVGYELCKEYIPVIKQRFWGQQSLTQEEANTFEFVERVLVEKK